MNSSEILQLKITPFEHYLYADDSPSYPMSCFMHLKFQGLFNRDFFQEALLIAIQSHPLCGSLISGHPKNKTADLFWTFQKEKMPYISWEKSNIPITYPEKEELDLSQEIGLRLWIRETKNSTFILIQFHHSITDGIGFSQFFETFLNAYHHIVNQQEIPIIKTNIEKLTLRNVFNRHWKMQFMQTYHGFLNTITFFKKQPISLCAHHLNSSDQNFPMPSTSIHRFEVNDLKKIHQFAKQHNVTINDLLLLNLFNALKIWILQTNEVDLKNVIRIAVPMNLREENHYQLPAANITGLTFVTRQLNAINHTTEFLLNLNREMELKKKWRLSTFFLKILRFFGQFPGGIKKIVKPGKCRSSTVLSNLGSIFKSDSLQKDTQGRVTSGNTTLLEIEPMGPLRHKTSISFTVYAYADILHILLYYDSRLFNKTESNHLLGLVIAEFKKQLNKVQP